MTELHLTKKDFKLEWYSGQGAGGQHRNKHQNCCRITHIESGLSALGTESRQRTVNQKCAFNRLATLLISRHQANNRIERHNPTEVIRTYHAVRNEVHDKASNLRQSFKDVVGKGDISTMIEARKSTLTSSLR